MKKSIDDFGKKIGGARKDQWKSTSILAKDVKEMSDIEKTTYIKKDNVWPKPDYVKMVSNGIPQSIAYFHKVVRDSVAVTPDTGKEELYCEAIEKVRNHLNDVRCDEDIDEFRWTIIGDPYFIKERISRTRVSMSDAMWAIGGKRFLRAIQKSSYEMEKKAESRDFGLSEDEVLLSGANYRIVLRSDEREWNRIGGLAGEEGLNIPADKYVLFYKNCYHGFYDTEDDAIKNLLQTLKEEKKSGNEDKPKRKTGKENFYYRKLNRVIQSNSKEFPEEAEGEDFLRVFGFAGGEFGNWVSNSERQKDLNLAFISFSNLARALELPPSAISLGGELSIAFGSRGKGSALAHYEPVKKCIALIRRHAGSLAHEYGHALDFILGYDCGLGMSFMQCASKNSTKVVKSEIPSMYPLLKSLWYVMDAKGQVIAHTDYFRNSVKMDKMFKKNGAYWSDSTELLARAFATYIKDKLESKGITDDFLCGHAEMACATDDKGNVICAYPTGADRVRINIAFDKVMREVRRYFIKKKEKKDE